MGFRGRPVGSISYQKTLVENLVEKILPVTDLEWSELCVQYQRDSREILKRKTEDMKRYWKKCCGIYSDRTDALAVERCVEIEMKRTGKECDTFINGETRQTKRLREDSLQKMLRQSKFLNTRINMMIECNRTNTEQSSFDISSPAIDTCNDTNRSFEDRLFSADVDYYDNHLSKQKFDSPDYEFYRDSQQER